MQDARMRAARLWRAACLMLLLAAGFAGASRPADAASWSVSTNWPLLQVSYGGGSNWPVYAAFYLDSSYYRLNPGPGSGWGTSLILQPCYWSGGVYHQGGPMSLASSTTDSSGRLVLTFQGTVGALSTTSTVTLFPPFFGRLTARVQVSVSGSVQLDNNRPNEAFKPVALSSMHDSDTIWDSCNVLLDNGLLFYYPQETGWILQKLQSRTISLTGGTSDWKQNAPTVSVLLDQTRPVSGWITADSNPNDDNVLVWASSDTVLPSWSYQVTTFAYNLLPVTPHKIVD